MMALSISILTTNTGWLLFYWSLFCWPTLYSLTYIDQRCWAPLYWSRFGWRPLFGHFSIDCSMCWPPNTEQPFAVHTYIGHSLYWSPVEKHYYSYLCIIHIFVDDLYVDNFVLATLLLTSLLWLAFIGHSFVVHAPLVTKFVTTTIWLSTLNCKN